MKIKFLLFTTMASAVLLFTACSGGGKKPPAKTPGTLSLANATLSVAEDAGSLQIAVTRTGGTAGAASVDFATQFGTADANDLAEKSGNLTWTDGDGANKTITINITNDTELEFNETFSVRISNANGASLGTTLVVNVTLTDDDSVVINGQVQAPNGAIGADTEASVDQWLQPVGGGVNVKIFAIDFNGDISGGALSTAVTDSGGNFEILAPADAVSESYLAVAGDTDTMESHLVTTAALRINPVTDATRKLVDMYINSQETDYSDIDIKEIQVIQDQLHRIRADFDLSGNDGSAASISDGLIKLADSNHAFEQIVLHSLSGGLVCGRVFKHIDTVDVGLANIDIEVHDFVNRALLSRTFTDSDGSYCINVETAGAGYIIGAINRTGDEDDPHHTASEWWTNGGGTYFKFDAEPLYVGPTAIFRANETVIPSVDFELVPGKRIGGTVTAIDGGSTEGVKIQVRDHDSFFPVASARVGQDGSYRVNVAAMTDGKYMLVARNTTFYRPYATQIYTNTGGTHLRGLASPVASTAADVDAASTQNYDFALGFGTRVHGQLTTPAAVPLNTLPIAGVRVTFDAAGNKDGKLNGAAARFQTNNDGFYQIWLADGSYDVRARGQTSRLNLVANSSAPFADSVADFDGVNITSIRGFVLTDDGKAVGQAKVMVRSNSGLKFVLENQEISGGDGSFQVFHDNKDAAYAMHVRIDGIRNFGNIVYQNQLSLDAGSLPNVDGQSLVLPTSGSGITSSVDPNITDMVSLRGINAIPNEPIVVNFSNLEFFKTRARGDGTFTLNLPTGTVPTAGAGDIPVVYNVVFSGTCAIVDVSPADVPNGVMDANDCQTPQ